MVLAGAVYPVTAFALDSTTPVTIAALRALLGGLLLTLVLPLFGSRLPRSRHHWRWAFLIGFGNTTVTQVAISVATDRAGAAVASVLLNSVALHRRRSSDAGSCSPSASARLRAVGLVVGFAGVLRDRAQPIRATSPSGTEPRGRPRAGALIGAAAWAARWPRRAAP